MGLYKNWFDWYAAFGPSTWSNWILAAFAIVATVIGLRTLRKIRDQTKAAIVAADTSQRSAKAAEKSVDTQRQAMLTVERPHLLFENPKLFGFSPEPPKDSDPKLPFDEYKKRVEAPTYPSVTYRVKNYGKSPAWITKWAVSFKSIDQLPQIPAYEEQKVIGFAIPAGEAFPQESMLQPVGLSYNQRMRILERKERLFIYGFIEYTDIFKEIPHQMGFCWIWSGPSTFFGPDGIWEPSGPESYWYYD
jgi:hypothetical protein